MIITSLILPKDLKEFWPKIKDHLMKSVKYTYGRYNLQNIHDAILHRNYHLWVVCVDGVYKGAVVTNITEYPQKKFLCMHFTGGYDLKEWKQPMLDKLRKFAIDMNCDGIESSGRPGWVKIFSNNGVRASWITYELPLTEEKLYG
jgi:hypothetical protein